MHRHGLYTGWARLWVYTWGCVVARVRLRSHCIRSAGVQRVDLTMLEMAISNAAWSSCGDSVTANDGAARAVAAEPPAADPGMAAAEPPNAPCGVAATETPAHHITRVSRSTVRRSGMRTTPELVTPIRRATTGVRDVEQISVALIAHTGAHTGHRQMLAQVHVVGLDGAQWMTGVIWG